MAAKKKSVKAKSKAKAKIGTRRSTLKKKRQPKRYEGFFIWAKRLGLAVFVVAVGSWGAVWFFLSDADMSASSWAKETSISVLAKSGFVINNILVEGRENSDPDMLLALINVGKGDPIFSFKPKEAKTQIEKMGWVKSVRVERRLPDSIYLKLEERRPMALWQSADGLSLIDSDGAVITKSNLENFKNLLMIRGKGAPLKTSDLIAIIDAEESLKALIDNAELLDNRRWNLYMRDGKIIKLPANDMGLALRNVALRHKQDDILGENAITVIDARYQGRLIVRTKLGKVQDYKAATSL